MTAHTLAAFVDDELLRAPLLAEQVVEEALLVLKREAAGASPGERSLAADVQRSADTHRRLVVREFARALGDGARAELQGHELLSQGLPSGPGGLSLVDESQVEIDVEISRAIAAIRSTAEAEIRELMGYTSAMMGDMEVARDYNPFRPEVVVRAFWSAVQALPLKRAHHIILMRHACLPLARVVRKSYAGACARLEAQGVEPAAYRTIIVFGSRRTKGQQDSFFDPAANRAERSSALPGPAERPRAQARAGGEAVVLGQGAGAGVGAAAAGAAAAAPSHAAAPRLAVEQVLARADEMLRNLPAQGGAQQREAVRTAQRQQLMAGADTDGDRELIDVIGRSFDAMLGDRRLAIDMQNLLSRLQAPTLRLALTDPSVLDQHTHPLWLLMDRMALQGDLHPPPGDPERTRMLRFMHGLVDTIVQEQPRTADAFRWARERVATYERARFEQRRDAAEAELHSLQALEDRVVAGGPAPTIPGALDVGTLDTVPASLLDGLQTLPSADPGASDTAQWLAARRSSDWVHMFMQGQWVHAQLLWYGRHREYWLFADGATANTWALRSRVLDRMLASKLLSLAQPRSLIRDAATRVLRELSKTIER